nr:hypothetical protein [Tanacetum cinerariifolium]
MAIFHEILHSGLVDMSDSYLLEFLNSGLHDVSHSGLIIIEYFNFWYTLTQEAKTGVYRFQLDEDWFTLDANLLREALEITRIDQVHQFESPPSGNAIIDFINELGYPKELHFVSRMVVNNLYHHWRAILSMINQCLTGKTSGYDRPRYPGENTTLTKGLGSPFNMAEDDHHLGNLKFAPKGKEDEHDHKFAAEEGGKKKPGTKADQSKKPATAKKPKPVSFKQSKPAAAKQPKPMKEKSTLVKKAAKVEDKEYDLQRGIQMRLEMFQAPGQALVGGVAFYEPASGITHKLSIVEDAEIGAEIDKTNNKGDIEILNIGEEQGEDVATKVDLEEKTAKMDEGQAGSDPGKTPESRPPSEHILIEEDHDQTLDKVKWLLLDQTLSPCMMTLLPLFPLLSTPVVDLTPPKPVSSTVKESIFTATTKTTTTTLPPPPPQQQSTIDHALASRVSTLETIRKSKFSKADLEGPAYKIDLVNSEGHQVVPDVSKPLPLGGSPGQATNYPDFGLEELVPSLWIKSKREYDISATHGISHWWFKRKEFYVTRNSAPFDHRAFRSHMRILSVTIVSKPRAIIYRDRNDQKKMMRETKVHKFSDGTLTRILEKLDHMVKDFKLFKYNPSMET